MRFLIAITLPVWLFIAQFWLSFNLDLDRLIPVYASFLFFYYLGAVFGLRGGGVKRCYDFRLTPRFLIASKLFISIKILLLIYFFLIFLEYYFSNGYEFIRGYMTGEEIKNSRFYLAIFMYLDAYIMVPLNFIFLSIFLFGRENKMAAILAGILFFQYVVIYAGRMAFYNFAVFAIFYLVYKRISLIKIFVRVFPFAIIAAVISFTLVFSRDNTYVFDGGDSIQGAATFSVLNYHLVPPLIFDDIIKKSEYFNSRNGFGLATFGFIFDPLISIFTLVILKNIWYQNCCPQKLRILF